MNSPVTWDSGAVMMSHRHRRHVDEKGKGEEGKKEVWREIRNGLRVRKAEKGEMSLETGIFFF